MDNLTFGRYSPFNTFIHKLDPRNKIFLLSLLIATIFFKFDVWSTNRVFSGLMFVIILIFCLISKIKLSQIFNVSIDYIAGTKQFELTDFKEIREDIQNLDRTLEKVISMIDKE
jgi:hypothetical protein